MNYHDWEVKIPVEIKGDPLWKVELYRLALLMTDLSWSDATKLLQDKRTLELSSQLLRAVGSISANFAEGYSRGTGKDRARFYGYALGSARESRVWYYQGRHILTFSVAIHRVRLLTKLFATCWLRFQSNGVKLCARNLSYTKLRIPSSMIWLTL